MRLSNIDRDHIIAEMVSLLTPISFQVLLYQKHHVSKASTPNHQISSP